MKSLFHCLCAFVLVFLLGSVSDAGPLKRLFGRGSCSGSASQNLAASPGSVCGPCAYAGVPCTPASCAAACTAGCSTGCPSNNVLPGGMRLQSQAYECDPITGICKLKSTSLPDWTSKVSVGDRVTHTAGLEPPGTGVIDKVLPLNSGKGTVYTVRCDKTGKVLPVAFEEAEVWKH